MLATRLLTASFALLLFLAALFFLPPAGWTACLAPALLFAAREWAALAGCRRGATWIYAGVTTAFALLLVYGTAAGSGLPLFGYAAAAGFWLLIAPLWLALHWRLRGLGLALVGWIVLIPTWIALVQLQSVAAVLLYFLGVVWIADTAAYLTGRRWGRRKLAPDISPGKTWEGVAGAAAAVAVYYGLLQALLTAPPPALRGWLGALAFALTLALSIVGDLFESWLKRQAGVKDSGRLLPGHGGILDRIDGLTATVPVVALLLHYLG